MACLYCALSFIYYGLIDFFLANLINTFIIFSVAVTADWNSDVKPKGVHFAVLASPFVDESREACVEFTFAGNGEGMKLLISRYMYGIVPTASDVLGYSVLRDGTSFTGQVDISPVSDRYRVLIALQYSAFMSVTLTSVVHTHTYCKQRGMYRGFLLDEMQIILIPACCRKIMEISRHPMSLKQTEVYMTLVQLWEHTSRRWFIITAAPTAIDCYYCNSHLKAEHFITLNFRVCYETH